MFIFLTSLQAHAFNPAVLFETHDLDDDGFVQSTYEGVMAFSKYKNTEIEVIIPEGGIKATIDYLEKMLINVVEHRYDPIVCVGFSFGGLVEKIAAQHPDVKFIIIDYNSKGSNVQSILFREEEGAFLMGYLAATASKTQKIGFVGGMDISLIRKFGCAYAQGAKDKIPDIIVFQAMAGDTNQAWVNPDKGAELTRELIDKGVDVVFHAAGMTGLGVIKAAREAGILAIGVDVNQNPLAPGVVLTSMLKRTDVAIFMALSRIWQNQWHPGVVSLGVKEGGIDWSVDEHNIQILKPDMQKQLTELSFEIMAGIFRRVHRYNNEEGCPYLEFEQSARN